MSDEIIFKRTEKQNELTQLHGSKARHIMAYGGSRSGKTFGTIKDVIVRASKVKSRHGIFREKFNHAKTSLILDTIPKVLSLAFPSLPIHLNRQDWYYTLPNGSEIWVAGLDNKERTEKILGKEFSTLFFNESSQIAYSSVKMALTRLAEKNDLVKKAYYDMNPPAKSHWSYPVFFMNKDPDTWDEMDPDDYAYILMTPGDNLDNIDKDYIDGILKKLSPKERDRFLYGKFAEATEGAIYYAFNTEIHVQEFDYRGGPIWIGMDFNVNPMTAIVAEIINNRIFVFDEIRLSNSNTYEMGKTIKRKFGWDVSITPDSTGSARKTSSKKSDHQILRDELGNQDAVKRVSNPAREDRFNCVNGLFDKHQLVVNKKCKWLIKDLEQCAHDIDDPALGHISDALGYLAWYHFPIKPLRKRQRTVNL